MPTGIFPEAVAGGVVYRELDGTALLPPGVHNAYSPPPAFVAECTFTALPSDCTARIEPRQINAIVSELVALAECFDPNGPWDCNDLNNLCTAFTTWWSLHMGLIHIGDTPPTGIHGRLWWESDSGILFIYYDDGTSAQWVQVCGGGSGGGAVAMFKDNTSFIGLGTVNDPHRIGVIDCGSY